MGKPGWVGYGMWIVSLGLLACEQPVAEEHPEAHSFGGASAPRTAFPLKPSDPVASEAREENSRNSGSSTEDSDANPADGCLTKLDCATPSSLGSCLEVVCELGECLVVPTGDGEVCTTPDFESNLCILQAVCNSGKCVQVEEVDCPAAGDCMTNQCNPNTGECVLATEPGCIPAASCVYDGDCIGAIELAPCEMAECIEGTCVAESAEKDSLCFLEQWTDSSCIVGGHCTDEGTCAPTMMPCDDQDPCTTDSCSPELGECVFIEDEEACGAERGRPQGTLCDETILCEDGICEDGICISSCESGATCPIGSYCDFEGACQTLKGMGDSCEEDGECVSGACEGSLFGDKECVCLDHTSCPEGYFCATAGVNSCEPIEGICEGTCFSDKECGSDAICAGFPSGQCVVPGSNGVGQLCCRDAQCASGVCGADGLCQCNEDWDCQEGVCDTSLFGENICVECTSDSHCSMDSFCAEDSCTERYPVGTSCSNDSECISNVCGSAGFCQCASDTDCGPELICSLSLFGANACVECTQNSDCSAGHYCDVEICRPRVSVGEACWEDMECLSGACSSSSGTCECKVNEDCGESLLCDTSLFGENTCVECQDSDDCGPGLYCQGQICLEEKEYGALCSKDDQCSSGICETTCTCIEDSDCPNTLTCSTSIFGQNSCVICTEDAHCGEGFSCHEQSCTALHPVGHSCTSDEDCLSGRCDGDLFGEGNCACDMDSDCPMNQLCEQNWFSPNECVLLD